MQWTSTEQSWSSAERSWLPVAVTVRVSSVRLPADSDAPALDSVLSVPSPALLSRKGEAPPFFTSHTPATRRLFAHGSGPRKRWKQRVSADVIASRAPIQQKDASTHPASALTGSLPGPPSPVAALQSGAGNIPVKCHVSKLQGGLQISAAQYKALPHNLESLDASVKSAVAGISAYGLALVPELAGSPRVRRLMVETYRVQADYHILIHAPAALMAVQPSRTLHQGRAYHVLPASLVTDSHAAVQGHALRVPARDWQSVAAGSPVADGEIQTDLNWIGLDGLPGRYIWGMPHASSAVTRTVLTGSGGAADLTLSPEQIQIRKKDGEPTMVHVRVPSPAPILEISERLEGQIVVHSRVQTVRGVVMEQEIARATVDGLQDRAGGVELTGHMAPPRRGAIVRELSELTLSRSRSKSKPGAINEIQRGFDITEGFEDDTLAFDFDGDWVRTTDRAYSGSYSYRSKDIFDNEISSASLTLSLEYVSFWYFVSSESGYDYFYFYVDGEQQISESGEPGWQFYEKELDGKEHSLTWEFDKDYSVSSNDDRAYIDDLRIKNTWTEIEPKRTYEADVDFFLEPGDVIDEGKGIIVDSIRYVLTPSDRYMEIEEA